MPTEAAWPTSRMVLFLLTASIGIDLLPLGVWLGLARKFGTPPLPRASLAHQSGAVMIFTAMPGYPRTWGRSYRTNPSNSFHKDSDLTEAFRSVRVWNQFQAYVGSLWIRLKFFRTAWGGDVMKKPVWFVFPMGR